MGGGGGSERTPCNPLGYVPLSCKYNPSFKFKFKFNNTLPYILQQRKKERNDRMVAGENLIPIQRLPSLYGFKITDTKQIIGKPVIKVTERKKSKNADNLKERL